MQFYSTLVFATLALAAPIPTVRTGALDVRDGPAPAVSGAIVPIQISRREPRLAVVDLSIGSTRPPTMISRRDPRSKAGRFFAKVGSVAKNVLKKAGELGLNIIKDQLNIGGGGAAAAAPAAAK